jgi:hypothetical protein
MPKHSDQYANLGWTVDDVTDLFDCTAEEATSFLIDNERHIRDRMCEVGWDIIETLGVESGLKKRNDDQDDEEPSDEEDPTDV